MRHYMSCLGLTETALTDRASDDLVLPVLAIVEIAVLLHIRLQAVIDVVASVLQVLGKFAVDAVEQGALRHDFRGSLTNRFITCAIDDGRIVADDVWKCHREQGQDRY